MSLCLRFPLASLRAILLAGGLAAASSGQAQPAASAAAASIRPAAQIKAALQPSRLSGSAPLAVFFDATGTQAPGTPDPFSQLRHEFDFGDDPSAVWPVSGLPRHRQAGGPLAAHVFDKPGTYTVKLSVSARGGARAETSVTITVQDPDAVYAGSKTVCVSAAERFEGCPARAARQSALPESFSGKRVLLRRGERFGDISIQDGNSGVQLGAFGSGPKPQVGAVGIGSWRPKTAEFARDITVMDLAVTGGMAQSLGSRVLILRNELTNPGEKNGIYFGGIKYWAQDDPYRLVPTEKFQHAREIFIVENTVLGNVQGDGYNVFGDGSHVALLGNVMGVSKYHTVRLTAAYKAVLAHNELRGVSGAGTYHALKVHGGGLAAYDDHFTRSGITWASDWIVVADNVIGSSADNNQWTAAICPQNGEVAEGVENVVVERNRFVRGRQTVQDLALGGRHLTVRGNTVRGGSASASASASAPLRVGRGHTAGLPAAWNEPARVE